MICQVQTFVLLGYLPKSVQLNLGRNSLYTAVLNAVSSCLKLCAKWGWIQHISSAFSYFRSVKPVQPSRPQIGPTNQSRICWLQSHLPQAVGAGPGPTCGAQSRGRSRAHTAYDAWDQSGACTCDTHARLALSVGSETQRQHCRLHDRAPWARSLTSLLDFLPMFCPQENRNKEERE